jgi:hypothetical protein
VKVRERKMKRVSSAFEFDLGLTQSNMYSELTRTAYFLSFISSLRTSSASPKVMSKIEDLGPDLVRERRELVLRAADPRLEDLVLDPIALLRGDVGCGRDALGMVNEEEDEDLAVAVLGRVDETERSDLVLEDVGERDGATGRGEEQVEALIECAGEQRMWSPESSDLGQRIRDRPTCRCRSWSQRGTSTILTVL